MGLYKLTMAMSRENKLTDLLIVGLKQNLQIKFQKVIYSSQF